MTYYMIFKFHMVSAEKLYVLFFLFFRTASHSSSVSLSSWIFRSVCAFSIRLIRLIRLIGLIRNYFMKLLQLSFRISMLEQNLSKVSSRDLNLYFTNQMVMSSNPHEVKIFNVLYVNYFIVKRSSNIFENSFLKNGILEFLFKCPYNFNFIVLLK